MSENCQNGEEKEEEEQLFELYSYLPPENRMMIVDKMSPRARCLFGGLSRLSWKEAKLSKNAIYGLSFIEGWGWGRYTISVSFSEEMDGFKLVFLENETGHSMEYQRKNGEMLWKIDLDKSTPVAQPAIAHFKQLLKMYQDKIKYLGIRIYDETIQDIDYEIDSLKNVDSLTVQEIDIRQFLPKLRRPLKKLNVDGVENCEYLQELEETYQISGSVHLGDIDFNYEQFMRLNARDVIIPIGQLTEQNIVHFLTSWLNRTYNGRIESCQWNFYSIFDRNAVFQRVKELEGITVDTNGFTFIKQKESGELAKLEVYGNILRFLTHRYEYEIYGVVYGEVVDRVEESDSEEVEEIEVEDEVEDMDSEEVEDQVEVITIDDSNPDDDVVCLN